MDVEGGFASIAVFVDQAKLAGVPSGAIFGANESALSCAGDCFEGAAEGEIDEFDVVDGDVGSGISARDPFGKLRPGDLAGFKERTVTVVDVLEDVVGDECAELLVIRIEKFVVDDASKNIVSFGDLQEFVELLERED